MDFGYTSEQEALRLEVRQFITENVTPDDILKKIFNTLEVP